MHDLHQDLLPSRRILVTNHAFYVLHPTHNPGKPTAGRRRKVTSRVKPVPQGVVRACHLQRHYHLALEYARALREMVKSILVDFKFAAAADALAAATAGAGASSSSGGAPAAAAATAGLPPADRWLHLVDEILEFERKLAPYTGILVDQSSELPRSVLEGGCMQALCDNPRFLVSAPSICFQNKKLKRMGLHCFQT